MVVINTKKIFITILVSALLLVCSALTVFAFDFSTPDMPNNGTLGYMQLVYNGEPNVGDNINCYPLMIFFCDNVNSPFSAYMYLTNNGFEYFSQNGTDYNSVYQYIDDFLSGGVGNAFCNEYTNGSSDEGVGFGYNGNVDIVNYYTTDWFDYRIEESLNRQYYNYESQYNNVLRSYDLLMQSYTTLNNNYQTLQTNYTNLQSDYNYINNEFELLTNSYNELDTQYRELAAQYSYYKNAYENSLIDIESLESTISNMQTVISQLDTIVSQLETELETSYMSGYTAAIEEINAFESGIYTIFSSPFVLVGELSQIEIFGTSITKIVGIILLFIILSVVLAFLWKVIPFV